jgi:hypothetical protein
MYTMFKEQYVSSGIPYTRPSADEDTVGTVYDMGKMGLLWRPIASDGSDRPLLDSDGTRNNFLKFTNVKRLIIPTHKNYLKPMYMMNVAWGLSIWLRMDQLDATNVNILTSCANSATGNGFMLRRNSTNKVNLICRNSTTTSMVLASTSNLTIAAGWMHVLINMPGIGGTATMYINGVSQATSGVGSISDAAPDQDLQFGSSNWYGAFSDFKLINRVYTAPEIAALAASNPARASTPYIIRQHDYDFTDSVYVFKDTSSTPATADSVVREVRGKIASNFGTFVRRLFSTADANSPIFKIDVGGGINAVRWPGTTGINMSFQVDATNFDFLTENAGNHLIVMIVKNSDPTFGSHTLTGQRYYVLTGENYAGAGGHSVTIHYSDSTAPLNLPAEPTDYKFNVIGTYRDGTVAKLFTGNGIGGTVNPPGNIGAKFDHIGDAYVSIGSDWNMHGDYVRLIKFQGVFTDGQIQQVIDHYKYMYASLIQ